MHINDVITQVNTHSVSFIGGYGAYTVSRLSASSLLRGLNIFSFCWPAGLPVQAEQQNTDSINEAAENPFVQS
jgi:hypothetical protein